MSIQSLAQRWGIAIAPAENVNKKYNNPGGLNMQGDLGSVHAAGGTGHDVIGVFSTPEKGYEALDKVLVNLAVKYPNKTLLEVTAIYVMGPNDPRTISGKYPQNVVTEATVVAKRMGVSIHDTIKQLC